jgi:hypothetical protein
MVVALKEGQVFVKRKHELADLLKQVEKGSKDAVELIVETMNATDEKVSLKTRLECAKALLDLQIKVSDTISRDELTRQIAEIKAQGLKIPLVPDDDDDKPKPPRLDMANIQSV